MITTCEVDRSPKLKKQRTRKSINIKVKEGPEMLFGEIKINNNKIMEVMNRFTRKLEKILGVQDKSM